MEEGGRRWEAAQGTENIVRGMQGKLWQVDACAGAGGDAAPPSPRVPCHTLTHSQGQEGGRTLAWGPSESVPRDSERLRTRASPSELADGARTRGDAGFGDAPLPLERLRSSDMGKEGRKWGCDGKSSKEINTVASPRKARRHCVPPLAVRCGSPCQPRAGRGCPSPPPPPATTRRMLMAQRMQAMYVCKTGGPSSILICL